MNKTKKVPSKKKKRGKQDFPKIRRLPRKEPGMGDNTGPSPQDVWNAERDQ
ncbi:MAG: hypothetical protein AABY10_00695 [Nanoarchaeota archaeon]